MVTFVDGGTPVVSGIEALTKPGGYQFTATGGNEPYTWSIVGTGVTINSTTGYVTLGDDACGSFIVSCTDCIGRSVSHSGTRVTNNGKWYITPKPGMGGEMAWSYLSFSYVVEIFEDYAQALAEDNRLALECWIVGGGYPILPQYHGWTTPYFGFMGQPHTFNSGSAPYTNCSKENYWLAYPNSPSYIDKEWVCI